MSLALGLNTTVLVVALPLFQSFRLASVLTSALKTELEENNLFRETVEAD